MDKEKGTGVISRNDPRPLFAERNRTAELLAVQLEHDTEATVDGNAIGFVAETTCCSAVGLF